MSASVVDIDDMVLSSALEDDDISLPSKIESKLTFVLTLDLTFDLTLHLNTSQASSLTLLSHIRQTKPYHLLPFHGCRNRSSDVTRGGEF
jgi:hypothetical protein